MADPDRWLSATHAPPKAGNEEEITSCLKFCRRLFERLTAIAEQTVPGGAAGVCRTDSAHEGRTSFFSDHGQELKLLQMRCTEVLIANDSLPGGDIRKTNARNSELLATEIDHLYRWAIRDCSGHEQKSFTPLPALSNEAADPDRVDAQPAAGVDAALGSAFQTSGLGLKCSGCGNSEHRKVAKFCDQCGQRL